MADLQLINFQKKGYLGSNAKNPKKTQSKTLSLSNQYKRIDVKILKMQL